MAAGEDLVEAEGLVAVAAVRVKDILDRFESLRSEKNIEGMKRFGIPGDYGVSSDVLRGIVKETGKNHELALELWKSGKHEARMLAGLIDDPKLVTEYQMDLWAKDFDSWDLTDNTCMHLFWKTPYAAKKVFEWSKSKHEFTKRAAFTLIVSLTIHDKKLTRDDFIKFLELIKKTASELCNELTGTHGALSEGQASSPSRYVAKAVNWALRTIGKKSRELNKLAIKTAREISNIDSKSARWIASDALREITSKNVMIRIKK